MLRRAGLGRRLARLAAAESLAASEGGPLTERVLREVRAIERAATVHIGSDIPGEELFLSASSPRSSSRWERETMTDMTADLSGRNVGRKV